MALERGPHLSRELIQALRDADMIPDCTRCKRSRGLCVAHKREILPQLAKPNMWLRLMGQMHGEKEEPVDRAELEKYERKAVAREAELNRATNSKRRRLRGYVNLGRAIEGHLQTRKRRVA